MCDIPPDANKHMDGMAESRLHFWSMSPTHHTCILHHRSATTPANTRGSRTQRPQAMDSTQLGAMLKKKWQCTMRNRPRSFGSVAIQMHKRCICIHFYAVNIAEAHHMLPIVDYRHMQPHKSQTAPSQLFEKAYAFFWSKKKRTLRRP